MNDSTDIETGVDNIVVRLHNVDRQLFGTFIDCNMSTAWVGDRFRLFPGKYGEDPVWGDGKELKIGEGSTVAETFALPEEAFVHPILPEVLKMYQEVLISVLNGLWAKILMLFVC